MISQTRRRRVTERAGKRSLRKWTDREQVDFVAVRRAALARLPDLLARWLPDGRRAHGEWCAKNPTRADRRRGSFSVNVRSGRWADFATGDKGGDPISLAAYLFGLSQVDAARKLARMLGLW